SSGARTLSSRLSPRRKAPVELPRNAILPCAISDTLAKLENGKPSGDGAPVTTTGTDAARAATATSVNERIRKRRTDTRWTYEANPMPANRPDGRYLRALAPIRAATIVHGCTNLPSGTELPDELRQAVERRPAVGAALADAKHSGDFC